MNEFAKRLALVVAFATASAMAIAEWKPAGERIRTRFAAEVTPENAWREYPRPQMVRDKWENLNGLWDYAVRNRHNAPEDPPAEWAGKILVPFCIESSLSGVGRILHPHEELWYRREVSIEKGAQRVLLHFEAVDYACTAWLNGKEVGSHKGGNTPFSFDITDAARDGANTLLLRVIDETGGYQLTGKQVKRPGGIFYTRVSGIWQTVWLETVPHAYIKALKIDTQHDPAEISIRTTVGGDAGEVKGVKATAYFKGREIASAKGSTDKVVLKVEDPKLWSPTDPNLYDLEVELTGGSLKGRDNVKSYAGIRTVGKAKDAAGNWRFTLNGEMIFHLGPLDQGWWPESLLTPPSEEAMLYDITYLRDAGFNMIRHHIKVRPRRYYYHCDKMGMMIWQDQVSTRHKGPGWTRMRLNPKEGDWEDEAHAQFMAEYKEMIDTLYNSPSIVVWVPFNEAWGQHRTMDVGKWTMEYDPTRLLNVASGGNFWPVGQIADHHSYPHPGFPTGDPRFADYIRVVGEFGGHGFVVDKKHLWNPDAKNWGYGGLPKSREELEARYAESIRRMKDLVAKGVAGGVYTQTSDIEAEVNGLLTYDRAVPKLSAKFLAAQHAALYAVAKEQQAAE